MQAGFIEQPEVVDFEVSVMGGPTLAGLIPSLKAWLIRFARDAIISHYVLPEQWSFRLDPVSKPPPPPPGCGPCCAAVVQGTGIFVPISPYLGVVLSVNGH